MGEITLALRGRLGNQMFEYAFAKALSLKYGCKLVISTFWDTNRLACFPNIKCNVVSNSNVNFLQKIGLYIYAKLTNGKTRMEKFAVEKRYQRFFTALGLILCENGFLNFSPARKNNLLIGFFQSAKYFAEYKTQILADFRFDTENMPADVLKIRDEISACSSVCVHIRLGDYVKHPLHGVCTLNYYLRAMEEIQKKSSNQHFFIFSDNIDLVKESIGNYKAEITYIPSSFTDVESMYLGSQCKNFILSNSSFSWWKCYLSGNENKIVFAPDKWFKKPCPCDIYLDSWNLISTEE